MDILVLNKPGKLTARPGNDKRITVSVNSVKKTHLGPLSKSYSLPGTLQHISSPE